MIAALRVALASAVLAVAVTARATTVIPPTFPELVAEAELIVRGTVLAVESRAVATPQGPAIHTFVTIAVEEVLKGSAPTQLTLTLLGGAVGDRRMIIAGLPRFAAGDREILFVRGNGRLLCPTVGLGHGRYRVLTDAATGRDYVARDNRAPLSSVEEISLPLLDPARFTVAARPAAAGLAPADFLAQVRAQRHPADARAR